MHLHWRCKPLQLQTEAGRSTTWNYRVRNAFSLTLHLNEWKKKLHKTLSSASVQSRQQVRWATSLHSIPFQFHAATTLSPVAVSVKRLTDSHWLCLFVPHSLVWFRDRTASELDQPPQRAWRISFVSDQWGPLDLPVRNMLAAHIVDRPIVNSAHVRAIQIGHWLYRAFVRHSLHSLANATMAMDSMVDHFVVRMLASSTRPSIDVCNRIENETEQN